MKKKIFVKFIALISALTIVTPNVIAFAKESEPKIMYLGFDDVITNMKPETVNTVGSENARVIEYADKNKAYSTDIGYVANEITIPFEAGTVDAKNNFIVSADMKIENDTANGEIVLKSSGSSVVVMKIIDGAIVTTNGKICGRIGTQSWSNIAFIFNTKLNYFSMCINKKCVLPKWPISAAIANSIAFGINFDMGKETDSYFLLDNFAAYNGEKILTIKNKAAYNETVMDYTPVDESGASKKVYINNNLDDPNNMGMNFTPKRNRINKLVDETGNGYIEFENVEPADDMYAEMRLPKTVKNLVLEIDFKAEEEPKSVNLFYLRDDSDASNVRNIYPFSVGGENGNLYLTDYTNRSMLSKGEWHKLSVVLNLKEHYMTVYCDGKIFLNKKAFDASFNTLTIWRFYASASTVDGKLQIDNVRAYGGTEPRDISQEKVTATSIYSDASAKEMLAGKTALSAYADTIYINGEKQNTEAEVLTLKDEALISANDFEKLFGEKVSVNGNSVNIGTRASFIVDEKTLKVGGRQIEIETAPVLKDGTLMLPVKAYGENVLPNGTFYDDLHGMFLVSKSVIDTESTKIRDANMYLFFKRKSANELKSAMQSRFGEDLTQHPRVMITKEDVERLKNEIATDKYKKVWFDGVRQSADALLQAKPSEYLYNDGNRLYNVAMQVESRCTALGMAYQITGDKRYAERCIQELLAIAEFPDWDPQVSCLDTGIMMQGAAIGYDWTYDAMTNEQRDKIQKAFLRLGVSVAHSSFYGQSSFNTFWTKTITNWSAWAVSGMLNLSLAIAEVDPDYCLDTAEKALRAMEYGIHNIAPDGAWDEGPMYWHWYIRALAYGLKGYETSIGEIHEAINFKGVDGLGVYQAHFSGPSGEVNDFHDSDSGKISDVGQFYIGYALNDLGMQKQRIEYMNKNSTGGSVYDLIYYDVNADSVSADDAVPLDAYFRGAEFVSMRQNWTDTNALWVSTHAGSSNAAHDHIDVGSFVMELDGINWATDFGKEQRWYKDDPATKAGYDSILYYRRKGEGHNIVVINPNQGVEYDRTKEAVIDDMVSGTGRAYAKIDLSKLYHDNVNSYMRGYLLSEGRRAFTVRDEIELKNNNSTLYWFMHTKGEIKIIDKNTATIYQDGKTLKVQLVTDASEYELMEMEAKKLPESISDFEETDNSLEGYTKLAVKMKASGKVNITVKMSMVDEQPSNTPVELTPIADWTAMGDDYIAPPRTEGTETLDNIKVGNGFVYAFKPETYRYTYTLGESETLTVEPVTDKQTTVQLYPQKTGTTLAEIRIFDSIGNYRQYFVEIKPYDPNDAGSYYRVDVVNTNASSCQASEGNYPENSADGNLGTRWSAEGKGEWLVHDFGQQETFEYVGVALWQGAKRNFYFKILASDNGEDWDEILDGTSCGTTEEIEIFKLPKPITARYIKYLGDGNSVNSWNNVIELAALRAK